MCKFNEKKGFSLIEVIVATSIFTIILSTLVSATNFYLATTGDNLRSLKAAYLAEEGVEAIKILRDFDWANINFLENGVEYYLYFDTSSSTNSFWMTTTTKIIIDSIYERKAELSSVYRDLNGRIVSNNGIIDPNTKKVDVSITWQAKNFISNKKLSAYITNI